MDRRLFLRGLVLGVAGTAANLALAGVARARLSVIGDGGGNGYTVTVMVNGQSFPIGLSGSTSTVGAVMSSFAARNDCGFGTSSIFGRYVNRLAGTTVTADSNPTWIYAVRAPNQRFDDTIAAAYVDHDVVSAGQIVEWQLATP